jgi:hypothetical protein
MKNILIGTLKNEIQQLKGGLMLVNALLMVVYKFNDERLVW